MSMFSRFVLAASVAVLSTATMAGEPVPVPPQGSVAATVPAPKPDAASQQAARIVNRFVIPCYTCGNNFPFLAGSVYLGGYNNVWEYGPRCTLPLQYRRDNRPYWCYR